MRDRGTGSVRLRPDGRWEGRVNLGVSPDGKRRRKSVFGSSRAEVLRLMKQVRETFEETGVAVTDGRVTVARFVEDYTEATLEARVSSGALRRSTAEWHVAMLRHAVEALGRKRLDAVRPTDVERMLVGLDRAGLAASTRRGVFTALSAALDVAVRDGHLARNPCKQVRRPSPDHTEAAFLSPDEVGLLLNAADGPMRVAILLLATTGLRRSEVLALRWSDVDLDAGTVTVVGSLSRTKAEGLVRTDVKTRSSRRAVPLPDVTVAALREHRREHPALPAAPVLASEAGSWWEPRNFSRAFAEVADRAGVEVTPHGLRHSAASTLIAAGVPLSVVSRHLGHSDVRITDSTYVHVREAQQQTAADVLGQALGGQLGGQA